MRALAYGLLSPDGWVLLSDCERDAYAEVFHFYDRALVFGGGGGGGGDGGGVSGGGGGGEGRGGKGRPHAVFTQEEDRSGGAVAVAADAKSASYMHHGNGYPSGI